MNEPKKTPEFLELYKKYFSAYADLPIRMLEIGVQHGGSIELWRNSFPKWEVFGLEINPIYAGDNIVIGDQSDKSTLEKLGKFDVIIDDGGHKMSQQQTSFDVLFRAMNPGGLYVIEDLHTSYWSTFLDQKLTTMQFLRDLTDQLQEEARNPQRCTIEIPSNQYNVASVHFYPSIAFICKK